MSLELMAGGLLALKGLSLLTRLVEGLRPSEIAPRLESGEPISEAEFKELLRTLLGGAAGAEQVPGGSPAHLSANEELVAALAEHEEALSPVLFRTLDADASGAIDGEELLHLQRLVSQLQSALPPDLWLAEETPALSG